MIRTLSVSLLLLAALAAPLSGQDWCHTLPLGSLPAPYPTAAALPKTTVTIPVVVHIVWRTEAERLTEAQVRSQLDVLNEDFRAANADLTNVLAFYQPVVADMEIQFELASQAPDGTPHTGIVYRQTDVPGIGAVFSNGKRQLCHDDLGGSTAWCTACYLNIWVADLGLPGVAGIGIFPTQRGTEVPVDEDGVYIQSSRFGRGGTVQPPYHLGRTTTHEVGHYLDLLHPWGAQTPPPNCPPAVCCNNPVYDDQVADTRPQVRTYVGECPAGNVVSCPPWPDNYNNFMGFADDACSLMFTQGQKSRARAALSAHRPGLIDPACPTACTTSATAPTAPIRTLSAYFTQGSLVATAPAPNLYWQLYYMDGRTAHAFRTTASGTWTQTLPYLPAGIYWLAATGPAGHYGTKISVRD